MFGRHWNDVLGVNARTLDYIKKYNSPDAVRIANNKLATKKMLQREGLATPRLYAVISSRQELARFRWTKLPASFVLKPNAASGGGGIVVIFGRNKKGNWVKADKAEMFTPELQGHVMDILDGNFSRGNVPDTAFFEQRVKVHSDLKRMATRGVPDIRILLYNFVPVMAMLRLPTEESGGRANLHAGGVGVGVDLSQGLTTTAIQRGHLLDALPGSRLPISGIRIPYWNDILLMATQAATAANLGFAGIDIAIDRDDGPMILELNARPGLEIQFANLSPLRPRLKRVEGLKSSGTEKRVRLAKELFGAEVEQDIEELFGRAILGIEEKVIVLDSEAAPHTLRAKVDTGAYRTAIDERLAKKLGLHAEVLEHRAVRSALGKQLRPVVRLTMNVRGRTITTEASIADRTRMNYDMIIGRRDMKGFLVDPSKIKPRQTEAP